MHKKGGKKCKKDTTQQRINYSKTIITLPDRFLKYKALVKTNRIGQVTVNIKRLGKHELTWQVLFLEGNSSLRPSVIREARDSMSSLKKAAWTEAHRMLQVWLFIKDFPWSKGLWDCQRRAHPADEGQKLWD